MDTVTNVKNFIATHKTDLLGLQKWFSMFQSYKTGHERELERAKLNQKFETDLAKSGSVSIYTAELKQDAEILGLLQEALILAAKVHASGSASGANPALLRTFIAENSFIPEVVTILTKELDAAEEKEDVRNPKPKRVNCSFCNCSMLETSLETHLAKCRVKKEFDRKTKAAAQIQGKPETLNEEPPEEVITPEV